MKKINLQPLSREHRNIYLKEIDPGVWQFCADKPDEWILEYMRCILDECGIEITAIDPSGGPFLSVGDKIGNIIIDQIEIKDHKFLLYAKNKEEI